MRNLIIVLSAILLHILSADAYSNLLPRQNCESGTSACGTACCSNFADFCGDASLSLCCPGGYEAVNGICCMPGENNCGGNCCAGECGFWIFDPPHINWKKDKRSTVPEKRGEFCMPTEETCMKDLGPQGATGKTCTQVSDCETPESELEYACMAGCCVRVWVPQ